MIKKDSGEFVEMDDYDKHTGQEESVGSKILISRSKLTRMIQKQSTYFDPRRTAFY
jgi:hypothetical protein